MNSVEFGFEPLQHVVILAYGLNCEGRILYCKYDGHTRNYSVEYALNGEVKHGEFFEDQLEPRV